MPTEQKSSTSAKILYRPLGITSSIIGGIVAGQVFKQVWKHATPGDQSDPPRALESEYRMREVLIAAAVIDRGGARAYERWTGEWPGD